MKLPLKDRYKGSDMKDDLDQLTDNDKRLYLSPDDSSDVQLEAINMIVIIVNDYPFVLSLPSVSEAKKRTYLITIEASGGGEDVTLTDYTGTSYSDSEDWPGDYTLALPGDTITLSSDGQKWTVVTNGIQ